MGQILTTPVELTRVQRKGSRAFRCGVADMQGWRSSHEDAHEIICGDTCGTFWVLDGHGGDGASIFCAPELAKVHYAFLQEKPQDLPDDDSICKAFEATDKKFLEYVQLHPDVESGSTVVGMVAMRKEDGTYSLKVLNCGDSRALVIGSPTAEESSRADIRVSRPPDVKGDQSQWPLLVESVDHKPDRDIEKARIEAAGGMVSNDDPPRLDGNLAVSRGVGDFEYKMDPGNPHRPAHEKKVSCIPEIYEVHGLQEGSICVLACDGLWDVMENTQVASIVREQLKKNPKTDLGLLSALLVRKALELYSRDNVTVMIVQLSDGSAWAERSTRFNATDELMYFDKLIDDGENGLKDEHAKKPWTDFLRKCNFPAHPVRCAVSGRWYQTMWQCPGTGNIYMSRHCQKKGWAARKAAQAGKASLAEGETTR